MAVSNKAGNFNASVLENGSYKWKSVDTITLKSLLIDRLNLTVVDYLLMDNEGAEYGILPQLSNDSHDNLDEVR